MTMTHYKLPRLLTVALATVAGIFSIQAQNKSLEQASSLPDVEYVYVTGKTLSQSENFGAGVCDDCIINSVEIITCGNNEQLGKLNEIIDPIKNTMPLTSKVKENSRSLELYSESGNGRITRLLVLCTESDTSFTAVYITGDLDKEMLRSLHVDR